MLDLMLSRKRRLMLTSAMIVFSACMLFIQFSTGDAEAGINVFFAVGIFMLAAACEFVDTSLGMGYGTSLTPLLMLAGFSPADIIPSILASELLTGGFASVMHWKDGNFNLNADAKLKVMVPVLVVLSFAGALIAVTLSFKLSSAVWKYLIVGIICSMGVIILFFRNSGGGVKPLRLLIIGFIASFNKGVSGGGYGPLMTAGQVTSGISSRTAVAVTSFTEFFTSLVAFSAFVAAGAKLNYSLMAPLMLGAVCVVPFATLTVRRVKEEKLRRMIGVLTLILGSLIVVKALLN